MNIIQKVTSLLLLLCLAACGRPKSLTPARYVQYLESEQHDFVRKITSGGYEYKIQLATSGYMACKEEPENDSARKARIEELKPYHFFLIRMQLTNEQLKAGGGLADAQRVLESDAMVSYYDQQAAADISLRSGDEVLQPSTYHFENNYGLAAHNTIVVAFKTGGEPQDMELVFNDRFRNIPHIQANFSKDELQQLPSLK